jgi:enoyl-CoA hydratase/carnithine racemase
MAVRVGDADPGVRTVVIDREEERNALDRATLRELEAAFRAAGRDPAVRVIVLRGAGELAFCAGADLRELGAHASLAESREHFDGVRRVIQAMHRAGPPVIARVQGFALAGGLGLAVAADFTLAGEGAVLGLPEIELGLLPLVVSAPLLRAVGSSKVLFDLVLTGRRLAAREAEALGLVTRVVPDAALDGEVGALAERLAALSPTALRLGKEALLAAAEMPYDAALRYLREMVVLTHRSEDAREGIAAFLEKRRPVWRGR